MDNRQNNNNVQHTARQYVRQNNSAGVNPLCDKLRAKYGGRVGAAINRSEIRRAELRREAQRNGWSQERRPAPTYKVRSALRTYEPTEPQTATRAVYDRDVKIYDPAAAKREKALATASEGYGTKTMNAVNSDSYNGVTAMTSSSAGSPKQSTLARMGAAFIGRDLGRNDERKIKRNDFPVGAVIALVICALLFMIVVYCSMQKSVIESEISALEAEVKALSDVETDLQFELEVRDDLREIERYALENIGMVKKESVQTKYVNTVSEEKSRIITAEEKSGGVSAILSVFGNFLEYID
ncbi:MAG: hypothetical protein IKV54_02315 [Clostridia bacterium]|nr:hypothetical protein [Clostridia bacterium]